MSGPRHISAREWRKPSNADGSTGSRDLDFRVLVSVMPRCQRPKHTKVEKSRADICANQAGELWVLCTVVQASCGGRMGGSVFSRFVQEGSCLENLPSSGTGFLGKGIFFCLQVINPRFRAHFNQLSCVKTRKSFGNHQDKITHSRNLLMLIPLLYSHCLFQPAISP